RGTGQHGGAARGWVGGRERRGPGSDWWRDRRDDRGARSYERCVHPRTWCELRQQSGVARQAGYHVEAALESLRGRLLQIKRSNDRRMLMSRMKVAVTFALSLGLWAGVAAASAHSHSGEKQATHAKVSMNKARATALAKVPGGRIETGELER